MKKKKTFPKPNIMLDEESEITRLLAMTDKERQENITHIVFAALKFLYLKGHTDLTRDEFCAYTGFNRQRFIKAFKYLLNQHCVERVGCGIKKQPFRYRLAEKERLELVKHFKKNTCL